MTPVSCRRGRAGLPFTLPPLRRDGGKACGPLAQLSLKLILAASVPAVPAMLAMLVHTPPVQTVSRASENGTRRRRLGRLQPSSRPRHSIQRPPFLRYFGRYCSLPHLAKECSVPRSRGGEERVVLRSNACHRRRHNSGILLQFFGVYPRDRAPALSPPFGSAARRGYVTLTCST